MPSPTEPTRLAPGVSVFCSDARAGTLADLVVEPISGELTHLVVEPDARFRQLRLVPMWMVTPDKDGPRVSLDIAHFRQLQRVLETDFVRSDEVDIPESASWQVRFSTCLNRPYFEVAPVDGENDASVPIADCSIRRGTVVMSRHGNLVGTVGGFLVEADEVYALIVSTFRFGRRRRDIVVPLSMLHGEPGDVVILREDVLDQRRLRETDVARHTPDPGWIAHSAHDKLLRSGSRLVGHARGTVSRLRPR